MASGHAVALDSPADSCIKKNPTRHLVMPLGVTCFIETNCKQVSTK